MKRLLPVMFLSAAVAGAQPLGLEEARARALASSRSLAKYNLAVTATALTERARLYSNLPSLSLGATSSFYLWNAEGRASEPFGASLGVSQSLFEGGKTLIHKEINRLATESARQDALAEYFNVLEKADGAYYAALEAAAALDAEERALQTADVSLAIAEVRRANGIINNGDYLKALSEKESREASRNQARRNTALARAKLAALTGLAGTPEPEPVDIDEALILHLGAISDDGAEALYGELWKLLEARNPALAKAALASRRAEKNLALSKREYAPSVGASLSLGALSYTPDGGFEASSTGRLTLSAKIPLDVWVKANDAQKSAVERDTALLNFAESGWEAEVKLREALLGAIAQAGQAASSRRALEYAEQHFEYVMERYRLAQSSLSELSDASGLASSSRNQFIKARYAFLRALSTLRALGAVEDEARLTDLLRGAQ